MPYSFTSASLDDSLKQQGLVLDSILPHDDFSGLAIAKKPLFDTLGQGSVDDLVFKHQFIPYDLNELAFEPTIKSRTSFTLDEYENGCYLSRIPIDYIDGSILFAEISISLDGSKPPTRKIGISRFLEKTDTGYVFDFEYFSDGLLPLQLVSSNIALTSNFDPNQADGDKFKDLKMSFQALVDPRKFLETIAPFHSLINSKGIIPLSIEGDGTIYFGLTVAPRPEDPSSFGYWIRDSHGEEHPLDGFITPAPEAAQPIGRYLNSMGASVGLTPDPYNSSLHPLAWDAKGFTHPMSIPEEEKGKDIYLTDITTIEDRLHLIAGEFVDDNGQSTPYVWVLEPSNFGEGRIARASEIHHDQMGTFALVTVAPGGLILADVEPFPDRRERVLLVPDQLEVRS